MGGNLNRRDLGSLPPDVTEWIETTAAQLRSVLADPEVRSQVMSLLSGEEPSARSDDENGEADRILD